MLHFIIAAFCVAIARGEYVAEKEFIPVENIADFESLFWPEEYTVKAIKMSLTSGLVEDFTAWKTNVSSRVDYNGGAVTRLNFESTDEDEEDTLYEILPETDLDENLEVTCHELYNGNSVINNIGLNEITPDVEYDEYKQVGKEIIINTDTTKFEFSYKSEETNSKKWIWAATLKTAESELWMPVKYEVREYNHILGLLTTHEVWYFSEFSVEVDSSVFEEFKDICKNSSELHKIDSEMVTKELMFINPENDKHVDHVFNSFKTKHGRQYKDELEHNLRRHIFKNNMRMVSSVNRKNLKYKLGINHLSDLTKAEMERRMGLKRRPAGKSGNIPFPYNNTRLQNLVDELPQEIDLRDQDLVSSVKDQESCGSCWTFGTTAAVEGALARINGGRRLSLSNQALVDCAWAYGAAGCDGGSDNAAYEWMMKFGLPTEEEYGSYKNQDGYCNIKNMTTLYPIKGYTDVTPHNKNALKAAVVNHGPLSVSVEVTPYFAHYSRGIFYEADCGPYLNHEVTLVGYGEEYGELYWILKNSWGETWGNAGYMQISAQDSACGVTTEPTYVVF